MPVKVTCEVQTRGDILDTLLVWTPVDSTRLDVRNHYHHEIAENDPGRLVLAVPGEPVRVTSAKGHELKCYISVWHSLDEVKREGVPEAKPLIQRLQRTQPSFPSPNRVSEASLSAAVFSALFAFVFIMLLALFSILLMLRRARGRKKKQG